MAAPRKTFLCHECGIESSKTIPNYNKQIRKIKYPLCTKCALNRRNMITSKRMSKKYEKLTKNSDIVNVVCPNCKISRKIQHRQSKTSKLCLSCSIKESWINNKTSYNKAIEDRTNNYEFKHKVNQGILSIPEDIRKQRSINASKSRNDKSLDQRKRLFISNANKLFNNKFKYIESEYINHASPITIICPNHGAFQSTPNQHLSSISGCKRCSDANIVTNGHQEILDYVKSITRSKIEINNREILDPYEIDIWVTKLKLGIEYHGIYWHSTNNLPSKLQNLHKLKADKALSKNILLLQIFETEWLLKKSIIKSIILSKLNASNKLYARKCHITELTNHEYNTFMNNNHLQGTIPTKYKFGLIFNNNLVCAIGISKHPKYEFELLRFANILNYTVIGGFSKLLKYALKTININTLMSYVDRRYSIGDSYTKIGFKTLDITRPNYFYTTGNKLQNLESRQKYQKHKLIYKLDDYDSNLTEKQNMFNNGYRCIWDAGHYKMILNK